MMPPVLSTDDPLPGLRVTSPDLGLQLQQTLEAGESRIPLLPLGGDAAYVWVPGNGSTRLKHAWLVASGIRPDGWTPENDGIVHALTLPHTFWLDPHQLEAVVAHRRLVAIWRDPLERFVAACRYRLHALSIAGADATPVERMNHVALDLATSRPGDLEWSLRTLPQTSYLSGRPDLYTTLLDLNAIPKLVAHWSQVSGTAIPPAFSTTRGAELCVADLQPEAVSALEAIYASDRAFLALARLRLGSANPFSASAPSP
jgi:hypothetical protein